MIAEFPRSPTNVHSEKRKSRKIAEGLNLQKESRKGVKSIRANSTLSSEIKANFSWRSQESAKAGISCDVGSDSDVGRERKLGQKKRSNKQHHHQGRETKGQEEKKEDGEKKQQQREQNKLSQKERIKKKQRANKKKKKHCTLRANKKKHHQHPLIHSKKTSRVLFLDYLRLCTAIEIVAVSSAGCGDVRAGCNHANSNKYAANYGNSRHFEHKTEIYALYRHLEIGGPLEQVQQQQQLKVGQIQIRLRFEMLFAEPPPPPPIQGHAPTAHGHAHEPEDVQDARAPPVGEQVMPLLQDQQNDDLLAGTTSNVELMEAMKKLDADLVALFATAASAEPLKQKHQQVLWPESESEQIAQESEDELVITPEIFRSCNALQLHLEALTLQPEGTQRMELVQNEVRPIFTVECQLSGDLIRKVPRYPMFHIMQFESEKFQSLTQCTRFGQTAQRQVDMEDKSLEDEDQSAGHVDITVWWREPGTCLNEMLGMGRLELRELYKASLLEQCKCVAIKRRDVHLGSVYVKVSLLQNLNGNPEQQQKQQGQKNESGNKAAVNCNSKAVLTPPQPPAPPPPPPQANNNNRAILDCVNFMAETNKVRLLRGYLNAGELRQLTAENKSACQELSLQPFWQSQPLVVKIGDGGSFELQEQFAIINDERFLQSVERQQLLLELRPLGGVVRLPLHQFFIAYRDASITNHLCKGKLPVISIDGWAPIVSAETQSPVGELKVLLAIGSESQIAQLKQQRGFDQDNNQVPAPNSTTDLLDMLQNAITTPAPSSSTPVMPPPPAPPAPGNFSFQLRIVGAAGLPLNPGYGKSKKQGKRQSAAKRFPPNEPPNTYVTFQAVNCNSQTYKSHEGLVHATPIVARSTKPQWLSKFRVEVSRDYRSNPQKLFILKLWKKAIVSPNGSTEPSPHEDAIIGFAALNLNQKQPGGGFPSGWHNIVDFNGRVTGGIEAHVEAIPPSVDTVIDQFEKSMELGHLQLGQAIKRKYTELEEISQRLRSRLVDVTGETLKFPEFDVDKALDSWQQDGDDDDLAEDFERALRTPTPPGSPVPSTSSAAQNPRKANGQE
ncbi:uncharacterized protein LOC108142597 isoform X1 [Drosophila elegans]|uniref:uncharacterized protein LOC108142597 isoform X1 n=3 Tax=Drosophila elegans TaxID=30023 RepID=UPI001BC847D3|nr:uncharacterized protein LOC108142597 isoform X1 [Drosophila elegans]